MDKKSSPSSKRSDEMEPSNEESVKPIKPPKPEDKPFDNFINEDLIPDLDKALTASGFPENTISLKNGQRPVTGGDCWMVVGDMSNGRKFWLCFETNAITSKKTIAIAEQGIYPSVLESFLIDEKKTTKALLISRLLQRLNGQKWLGAN